MRYGTAKINTDDERIYIGKILTIKTEDGETCLIKVTKIEDQGIAFEIVSDDAKVV